MNKQNENNSEINRFITQLATNGAKTNSHVAGLLAQKLDSLLHHGATAAHDSNNGGFTR